MHPVIFYIYKFPIHSYGLMLAISFLFGILLASFLAKKENLHSDIVPDVAFWVIISSIIGARLYYVILHFEEFSSDLTSIFNPFHGGTIGIGGLVMYGGFIGAIIASLIYFRLKKEPILPYADVCSASIGFGIFFTRIGCFLNGCCYGHASSCSIGVTFPKDSPAGFYQNSIHSQCIYPSQLFESIGGLIIAIIILIVGKRKTFPGFRFYLTGLLYAILRFANDFTRFYTPQEKIGSLSHNQIICIVFFIIFSGLILKNLLFKAEDETPKSNESNNIVA
jgi:phosphatidylglycerol:prolipoprotein diacylglycerol transferase